MEANIIGLEQRIEAEHRKSISKIWARGTTGWENPAKRKKPASLHSTRENRRKIAYFRRSI